MKNNYLFFDTASTTKCSECVESALLQYSNQDYGNPSSSHYYGQKAIRPINRAKEFFSDYFKIEPEQVIFTGSGTEANNLAICGIANQLYLKSKKQGGSLPEIRTTALEHPSVKRSVQSLEDFGMKTGLIPVLGIQGIEWDEVKSKIAQESQLDLVSIQSVNHIVGAIIPTVKIAELIKEKFPQCIFHTDCVQAFGKIDLPQSPSSIDLLSISAHKIGGPKGVGALIILNKKILDSDLLRPLIWGGGQEGGLRSGTQSAALIAGFHAAAEETIKNKDRICDHYQMLKRELQQALIEKEILVTDLHSNGYAYWNSPQNDCVPNIVSLSFPGVQSSQLARLLEDRKCLVSVGSACSSKKQQEPEPVLTAMALPLARQTSGIRISFSYSHTKDDIHTLVSAIEESLAVYEQLQGPVRRA